MADIKNLDHAIYQTILNPIINLPLGDNPPEDVNMLVETPQGSSNKYEFNTETGLIKLDRRLKDGTHYPFEYGAIPRTWDDDDDPLDIICLVTTPTFPGCILSARPIGVMIFIDGGEKDDKIIAVPRDDSKYDSIKSIKDLPKEQLSLLKEFMETYKRKNGDPKQQIVEKFCDKKHAFKVINETHKDFKKKFANQVVS